VDLGRRDSTPGGCFKTNRMKIAVCMMFRDEADILGRCLKHWRSLGATHFYLCDNGSADGSAHIAHEYAAHMRFDNRTNFPQAEITNALIQAAHADGCDWIFPVDADEFIVLPDQFKTLPEWLSTFPSKG
jgi:glycosyltransferase involved in cell wall biosynthesis